jgi:hypothetical protein
LGRGIAQSRLDWRNDGGRGAGIRGIAGTDEVRLPVSRVRHECACQPGSLCPAAHPGIASKPCGNPPAARGLATSLGAAARLTMGMACISRPGRDQSPVSVVLFRTYPRQYRRMPLHTTLRVSQQFHRHPPYPSPTGTRRTDRTSSLIITLATPSPSSIGHSTPA